MTERSINESALADVLNLPEPATHENSFDPDAPVIDKSLFYNLATLIVVLFCALPVALGTTMLGVNALLSIPGKIGLHFDRSGVEAAFDGHIEMMEAIESDDGIIFPESLKTPPETEGLNSDELTSMVADLEATPETEIFEKRTAYLMKSAIPEILRKVDQADELKEYLTQTEKDRAAEHLADKVKTGVTEKVDGLVKQFLPGEVGSSMSSLMSLNAPSSKVYLKEEVLRDITETMLVHYDRLLTELGYIDPATGEWLKAGPGNPAKWVFDQLYKERYAPDQIQQEKASAKAEQAKRDAAREAERQLMQQQSTSRPEPRVEATPGS